MQKAFVSLKRGRKQMGLKLCLSSLFISVKWKTDLHPTDDGVLWRNLRLSLDEGYFFTIWGIISFSRALLHGVPRVEHNIHNNSSNNNTKLKCSALGNNECSNLCVSPVKITYFRICVDEIFKNLLSLLNWQGE